MIKTILVYVDGDEGNQSRIDTAIGLADRFNGHVIGLHVMETPEIMLHPSTFAALPVEIVSGQRKVLMERADALRSEFEEKLGHGGVRGEWRQAEGAIQDHLSFQSRWSDITIVSQISSTMIQDRIEAAFSSLVLTSGLPVLAVPTSFDGSKWGSNVLVCWNGSQQAARAVHDAVPFLKTADKVTALAVGEYFGTDIPAADICTHLARHNVNAEALTEEKGKSPQDTILGIAKDLGADLIVSGAWGHSRVREIVLGGVTRSLLTHQEIPVFLSH